MNYHSSSDTSMTSLVTILIDKYIAVGLYIIIALLINETHFCRMHANNDLAYINCVSTLSEYNHCIIILLTSGCMFQQAIACALNKVIYLWIS